MEAKKYSVRNKSQRTSLSAGVNVVDNRLEPLLVLKVLIEGLACNDETGLWLKNLNSIPMVPRLAPFDLAYLDKDCRVSVFTSLLPEEDMPALRSPAVSALILPYQSTSASRTKVGDQLQIDEAAPPAARVAEGAAADSMREATNARLAEAIAAAEALAEAAQAQAATPAAVPSPLPPPPAMPAEPGLPVAEILKPAAAAPAVLAPEPELPSIAASEAPAEPLQPEAEVHRGRLVTWPEREIARQRRAAEEAAAAEIAASIEHDSLLAGAHVPHSARPQPAPQPAPQPGKQDEPEVKRNPVDKFFRWLYPALYVKNRRGARRKHMPALVAYDTNRGGMRPFKVADISSTGLYVVTDERWPEGATVNLTLQRDGVFEERPDHRIDIKADAVRWGDDGVGLSFLLPPGLDFTMWGDVEDEEKDKITPDDLISGYRLKRAKLFMHHICPDAEERVTHLLEHDFSSVRVANAVDVMFLAEELLNRDPRADQMRAHPDMVVRGLECGSWADVDWTRQLWAGLLVASCSLEGQDTSNLVYVELLAKMAPIHARILAAACAKATRLAHGSLAQPLYFTAAEMCKIAGSNDFNKIHRSIAHLADLGLLEKAARSTFISNAESTKTTPTDVGLQMYARCNGYRGAA